MIKMLSYRKMALILLCAPLLAMAGCWGSKYTLIVPAEAKADRAYVGDWDAVNSKGEHAGLVIRNVDDKQYYVETTEMRDNKPQATRYVGFIASVKNATFAHIREMKDDGTFDENWLLMRIELAGNKLTLRQLDDKFFPENSITSSEQLRQTIEENLDNPKMYADDETITATRVAK